MDRFFTELGRSVFSRWKKANFSLPAFPEIARDALEMRSPARHVEVDSLVRDFLLDDEQPFQTQSGFGEPELVVYDSPHFYIQILFWLEGTTDIHQHKFSGAFHVLQGSSLHSHFDFKDPRSITARLRVGSLRMKETRLLETGSTEPIVSGPAYIHSLFHLDTPSLTVVVRTHSDPGTGPQFTYLPPHIALDPFHQDALTTRRKQLLDVMEKTQDPSYGELVIEMINTLDFERGFFILQNGMGHLRALGRWEEALGSFEQKHGSSAAFIAPSLDEIMRRDHLAGLRHSFSDVEHRFFLALLLNVPRREDILRLTAERFPGDPLDTIVRWVEELAISSDAGAWILDAEFPASVDVPVEQQGEVFVEALSCFVREEKSALHSGSVCLSQEDVESLHRSFLCSSFRALVNRCDP